MCSGMFPAAMGVLLPAVGASVPREFRSISEIKHQATSDLTARTGDGLPLAWFFRSSALPAALAVWIDH
jgi:hypothetical protein